MSWKAALTGLFLGMVLVLVFGCGPEPAPDTLSKQPSDIPVPKDFYFKEDGSSYSPLPSKREGKLLYEGRPGIDAAAEFYKRVLVVYKWKEISDDKVTRDKRVLTFRKGRETLGITLWRRGWITNAELILDTAPMEK